MKINRQEVYNKYNGHCAYCGESITIKQMQVDHIWPQQLSHWHKDLDPNRPENLNPSCRKCNHFKHGYRLDGDNHGASSFRNELQKQVDQLRRFSQFDRALRFGLIKITGNPVRFHFEKIQDAPQNTKEWAVQPTTGKGSPCQPAEFHQACRIAGVAVCPKCKVQV